MPHIEVLPTSKVAAAPGWAYVPDVGYDPSKAPLNPAARKRNARNVPAATGGELSARQETELQRKLARLDKDSDRDIQIPVPKGKDNVRSARGKTTGAVKRILASQKTFANHLSDEEAKLAQQASHSDSSYQSRTPAEPATRVSKPANRNKRANLGRQATSNLSRSMSVSTPDVARAPPEPVPASPVAGSPLDPMQVDTPSATGSLPPHVPLQPELEEDDDPLLAICVPAAPSEEEIEVLLSAPPLSYNAARAAPPDPSGPPQRRFCEMCGYWGRARCMKCGARVCGLECRAAHEGSCSRMFA